METAQSEALFAESGAFAFARQWIAIIKSDDKV